MKKKLLLALTLLLSGVGMKAQSVSAGQMDERFNDNKLPYGWFTEGWEVDSTGVAKRKASSMDMENFNIADLLGGGSSSLNYLMTPPLSVQDGEVLSFSAKKGKGRQRLHACSGACRLRRAHVDQSGRLHHAARLRV